MIGIPITFAKKVQSGTDSFNNPVFTTSNIVVNNCLIAPIIEPTNLREQQAMQQSRDQVRVHMPKTSVDDVSNSDITYDGKVFHLDSDSVIFMNENTPTAWNRYFRAESVNG